MKTQVQIEFGSALKRRRNEQRITQEELAGRADISVVYLRGLESGRFNPTLNVLFDLGKGLGIHPAEMLNDIPLDTETRAQDRKRPGPAEGGRKG